MLPLSAIRWRVVTGHTIDGEHLGETNDYTRTITVPSDWLDWQSVLQHELAHLIYGLPGTTPESHPPIFTACHWLTQWKDRP